MLKILLLLGLTLSTYADSLKKANRYYKNNNTKKATKYYKKACDEGMKEGCDKYNELQNPITKAFTLISQNRGEEALVFLKIACLEGFTRGCTIYESSTGESISLPKEHLHLKKILNYLIEQKGQTKEQALEVALKYIWGKPLLSNLKYDVQEQYFLADLTFERKKDFNKKVTLSIPEENQKSFQTNFKSSKTQAVFHINGLNVKLKTILIPYLNKNYTAHILKN